ncbi:MAG TPA: AAA family ATPase, partial [Actinomycetota bacterium]|nr:AAA family ATPase [Actinomycetota bacterium]
FAPPSGGDGGVASRVLGTFLRWMQERPPGAFVVSTANDVETLPPEFLRKGRFDEIFFVDLPRAPEREEIFRLHLAKRRQDPSTFDLPALAATADGFSGAEIEQAVAGALYRAYAGGRTLATQDVVAELQASPPLSRTRADDLARLRAWAQGRARPV